MTSRPAFQADGSFGHAPPDTGRTRRRARSACRPAARGARGIVLAALAAVAAPAVALLQPRTLSAQPAAQGVVAGSVVAAGTNAPLADAQVRVQGTQIGVATNADGRFRLTGVPGTEVVLQVRRLGFQPAQQRARVGDDAVRVVLAQQATNLEQVVVTGTPGETRRRALGNAVSTIDAASVTAVAPVQSVQQLLNGRAPGVVVMPATGAVGTGSQVRVRGVASFSLSNNPLLVIDGVRVNNAAATGPMNQDFGSSSISRLNDINPDDIESIEVLKGPSAATLYGTEASNGVINILTKRGVNGAARWTGMFRQGVNYLQDWRNRFPTNYGISPATNEVVALSMDSLLLGNGGEDIFRNGRHQESQLSVSGGTSAFNYFASGGLLDAKGAEPSNSTRKYNARLNLGVTPSTKLRVNANFGVVSGPTNLSAEAGFGGRVWSTLLATPTTYGTFQHGYYSGIPRRYDLVYKFWQDLDRYTGSATVEHRPITWLQQRLSLGLDRTREGNNLYQPRIDSLVSDPTFGSDALGFRRQENVTTTYRTFDYAATATWPATPALAFATSGGVQYYRNATDSLYAEGAVFPTPGLRSVNATTTNKVQGEDGYEDATLGYYVQEQVNWRDRLFLTAAVRIDKSSAFGANFNRVYYPKYSLSYVASDEDWWQRAPVVGGLVNSFRLRGAYGEAGKAPGTFDALRTFGPVSGPGDSPGVTPRFIGNADLGPERGKEYELGFDLGALRDRLGAEVTYYHKKTTDAILFRQLAPSIGFSGTQPFNAGGILNSGWELSLRGTPYRGERFAWDVQGSLATNDNEVLSLFPGTNFVTAATYSNGPNVRHQVGFPAFAFFDRRVVSAQLDATGQAIVSSVLCDDGQGGTTPCYNADGSAVVAPLVYIGRSVPPREGSLSTTLTLLRNFKVYTQFDFKQGHRKVDGNTRVRCFFFGGRCRENFMPAESDPVRVAQVQSNGRLATFVTANASFAKWREITFAYTIPERLMRRVNGTQATFSISGRNLHTWTNYPGFEPEAMFLGGTRGGNVAFEQTTLPQITSWMATLNVSF